MEVDEMPRKVTAVTRELKNVHLSNKDVPTDVAALVKDLNCSALIRARYHLRDTKKSSTGLHSLPGKLLLKIADYLEDKAEASATPKLFTVRASVLAHVSVSIRKTYIYKLFDTLQFQVNLWPRDDDLIHRDEGSQEFLNVGTVNPFLAEGRWESDGEEKWFHHLKFKIDPKHLDDNLEALESPVYAEISFPFDGTRLTRPIVTLSVGQSHPWRWYNHFRVFWRVAVNSSWDRGILRRGFNLFRVACMIYAFQSFHHDVRGNVMSERRMARLYPPLPTFGQHAAVAHEPADEDLMEDVSDYADAEESVAESMSEDGGNEVGDPHKDLRFEVLGSHWSPSEVDAGVLEDLARREGDC